MPPHRTCFACIAALILAALVGLIVAQTVLGVLEGWRATRAAVEEQLGRFP